MQFPYTADILKKEIYYSIDKQNYAHSQRYQQLKKILQQVDDAIILEGIIKVFEDKSRGERVYVDQDFAGKLLLDLKPKSNLTLTEILMRTLNNYNASVEELPFYLAESFGLYSIENALDTIIGQTSDVDILESIKVFNYWLKLK